MRISVDTIEDAGPDKRARRLTFSNGIIRLTSAAVVRQMKIEPDLEFESDTLELDLHQVEEDQARERALRLLGYRERTESEFSRRLRDDGYPSSVVSMLASRFVELGLIDDERFGRMYARSRLGSGFGPRRVARELADKGLSPEIVAVAMSEYEEVDPVEAAKRVLGGRIATDRKGRERLIRRLVTKGYDYRTAAEAVGAVPLKAEDESSREQH